MTTAETSAQRYVERPIEDHGLIGDTRTAALVSSAGAIEWMCVPRFDSPPLFARLVGGADAGHFTMGPSEASPVIARRYRPDTVTLETTWRTPAGDLTLTEGMVSDVVGTLLPTTLLVRRLTSSGGDIAATVVFDPRVGERHRSPRTERRGQTTVWSWGGTAAALRADPPLHLEAGHGATVTVSPGRPVTITMAVADRTALTYVDPQRAWVALVEDEHRWRRWAEAAQVPRPYRDLAVRSLLTLRLLTYSPSGAPVAAPTTSLPEALGGGRNWDYRFAWPRDASIGIAAFLATGQVNEARRFLAWLLHASRLDRPRLPVLLTLHGRHPVSERELTTWPGYAGSAPVRVGNGAADQHQLDGYGWVIDAAWLLVAAGHPLNSETWRAIRGFADEVARRWSEPDAGIWEERGPPTHHVHSKLMAWLALDRALRIAGTHRASGRQLDRWRVELSRLTEDVTTRGYDPEVGAYTRAYGSDELDAAVLVLPLLGIEPPDAPRVRSTIDAIAAGLGAGGPLLYRYPPGRDGLEGGEGAFLPCSFWHVQALAATGRGDEARALLDQLVELASPLGLYAEEVDASSGRHLGNYPQALTHAALVQAVLALAAGERPLQSPGVSRRPGGRSSTGGRRRGTR
jgi:GH15 family glucan-1,4-alpha-glucosidase